MGNKAKTHRASAKRFRVTRTGKVIANRAYRRHLLSAKNRKKKRHMRLKNTLCSAAVKNILKNLPNR